MSGTTTFPTGLSPLTPARNVTMLGDDGSVNGNINVAQIVSQTTPTDIQPGGATSGQYMVFNGTNWSPRTIVIFSGAYADLSGKPTLSTVASTGAYADLTGRPTQFSGSYLDLTNKPTIPTLPTLATVATTGSYADLTNKPTIPSAYVLPAASGTVLGGVKAGTNISIALDGTISGVTGGQSAGVSTFNTRSGTVVLTAGDVTGALSYTPYDASNPTGFQSAAQVQAALGGYAPAWGSISGKPTFATIATSGAYADLSGKPTIPAAYTLPPATSSVIGGVKPGTGLTVLGDGTLNATGTSGVSTFQGRTGAVTLVTADVTGVLGFTPYDAANPAGFQTAANLTTKLAAPGPIGGTTPGTGAFTTLTLGTALPIASGGTGGTTAALARAALGAYDAANSAGYQTAANVTTAISAYTPAWTSISGKPTTFAPVIATSSVVGGVKQGSGVAIAGDGTLSVSRADINKGLTTLTSGATIATDVSAQNMFALTLGTNATLSNPTGIAAGATYQWTITQDGTGGRTLAYGSAFKWQGGTVPTLSTAAGAVDILTASTVNGTTLNCVLSKGFA